MKLPILFALLIFNQVLAQEDEYIKEQELNIQTKFKTYGPLLERAKSNSKSISQFNKGQKCTVLSYHDDDIYKVQFKKWKGFVFSEYLVVNTEMNNAVKAYKKKQNNSIKDTDIISEDQVAAAEAARLKKIAEDQAAATEAERLKKIAEDQAAAAEVARLKKLTEEQAAAAEAARLKKLTDEPVQTEAEKERLRYIAERQRLVELKYKNELNKLKKADSLKRIQDSLARLAFRNKCHYQMNEIDPYYKVKIIRTEKYKINDSLTIELYKNGNKRDVFITYMGNLGCASYLTSNKSYAQIRLENNEVVTIYHTWNIDCDNFKLRGSLSQSSISKLKNSPVQSIKLKGTKSSYLVNNIDYTEIFKDKLSCIDE